MSFGQSTLINALLLATFETDGKLICMNNLEGNKFVRLMDQFRIFCCKLKCIIQVNNNSRPFEMLYLYENCMKFYTCLMLFLSQSNDRISFIIINIAE